MKDKKKEKVEAATEELDKKVAEEIEEIEEIVAETIEEEAVETVKSEVEELQDEIADLKKELEEVKDAALREQAEIANFRKRILRDKEETVKYSNVGLVKDIIGPLDDFSRAIDAASKSDNIEAFTQGVKMIEERIYSLLKNNWGLSVIEEADVEFNPNDHEACLLEENDEIEQDMVGMILQKGYRLHGRVIRPAKVKVLKSKNS